MADRAETLRYAAAAAVGVAAGAAMGAAAVLLLRRDRCDGRGWKVLGDKAGGAHAQMMISADGGRLLKPLDQDMRSLIEVDAYETLQRSPLGPFICGFHGTKIVDGTSYMELDSAYDGMRGAKATLDIKLGRKTWEDNAAPEKIKKEETKYNEVYAASSAKDGFRVAGMKAGGLELCSENLKARHSLKSEEFAKWLLPAFFSSLPGYGDLPKGLDALPDTRGCSPDLEAAREVLGQLKALSAAAELGFGGSLRAASLLITREMRVGGRWCLRLIDLAHFQRTGAGVRDDNFCDGLAALLVVWEAWLARDGCRHASPKKAKLAWID